MLKRKIFYLITLILIFSVNVLYIDYEPFVLLIILILIPIVFFVIFKIQMYFCKIDILLSNDIITQGEKFEIHIQARNRFRVPISKVEVKLKSKYMNFEDDSFHIINFDIPGNNSSEIKVDIILSYCGSVIFDVQKIVIFDLLQIFKGKKTNKSKGVITVIPKILKPKNKKEKFDGLTIQESDEYSKVVSGDDPSEVFDLREYIDGDNLNRVHWKLSSKGEKLIVKEYSCPIPKTELILVELLELPFKETSNTSRTIMDHIYEVTYSLAHYFLSNEVPFKIAYYDISQNKYFITMIKTDVELKIEMINIVKMMKYEKQLAWKSNMLDEHFKNSRINYICYKGIETEGNMNSNSTILKDKTSLCILENNIFLVAEDNVHELIDSFYLKF